MSTSFEHSYDAERDKPSPLRYLRELFAYPALIWRNRPLVWNFYRREFHGRFRGSVLGLIWVLIHPAFLFLTYYLVFGVLMSTRSMGDARLYPLYLFVGIIAWSQFIETAMRATMIVVENGNLIQKVAFPAQLLPLHLIAVNTIVYVVGLFVYAIIALIIGWPIPGWSLLALPVILLVQSVFSLGFALFLAAGYVFVRDLAQIFPIFAQLWFFASPVIWFPEMLKGANPENWAFFEPYTQLNPMNHLLNAHRTALGISSDFSESGQLLPALGHAGSAVLPAVLTLVVGFLVFRSLQHRFADEV